MLLKKGLKVVVLFVYAAWMLWAPMLVWGEPLPLLWTVVLCVLPAVPVGLWMLAVIIREAMRDDDPLYY